MALNRMPFLSPINNETKIIKKEPNRNPGVEKNRN